jgi:hypothetical protein
MSWCEIMIDFPEEHVIVVGLQNAYVLLAKPQSTLGAIEGGEVPQDDLSKERVLIALLPLVVTDEECPVLTDRTRDYRSILNLAMAIQIRRLKDVSGI